jgi:hypothetical protein
MVLYLTVDAGLSLLIEACDQVLHAVCIVILWLHKQEHYYVTLMKLPVMATHIFQTAAQSEYFLCYLHS